MSDANTEPTQNPSEVITDLAPKARRRISLKPKSSSARVEEQSSPEVVVQQAEQAPALSATALKKEIAKKKRELRAATIARDKANNERVALGVELDESKSAIENVQEWQAAISRSYVWKVQQSMDSQLDAAKSDLAKHEESVKGLKPLDEGRLLALRKKFHSSLAKALWRTLVAIAIVTLIANLDNIPKQNWLEPFYDPQTSGPLLVASVILLGGVAILLRRFIGKELLPKGRMVKIFVWLAVIALAVFLLPLVWKDLNEKVVPWFKTHYWEILSGIGTVWLLAVLVALVAYYSGWTVFRREVQTQLHNLKAVRDGYVKTQQEVGRLSILYTQTTDWLEILANALYRPWKTNPDWGTTREFSKHFETFPHSLRVALASESNDADMAALENAIASRLLVQGWRNRAFEDLVSEVGSALGMVNESFTVDNLDHDLPHQTNNSRALLKKYLAHSASSSVDSQPKTNAAQGSGPAPSDEYLVSVARARLLDLIDKTQSQLLSQARPRVDEIIDNPLEVLMGDSSGIHEHDSSQNWDEFLRGSLGGDSIEQVPIGALTFTTAGRTARGGQDPKSYVLVPKRLGESVPHVASPEKVEVQAVGDDKPRSVEIVARIDMAGPVDFRDLALLHGGSSSSGAKEHGSTAELDSEPVVYGREDL